MIDDDLMTKIEGCEQCDDVREVGWTSRPRPGMTRRGFSGSRGLVPAAGAGALGKDLLWTRPVDEQALLVYRPVLSCHTTTNQPSHKQDCYRDWSSKRAKAKTWSCHAVSLFRATWRRASVVCTVVLRPVCLACTQYSSFYCPHPRSRCRGCAKRLITDRQYDVTLIVLPRRSSSTPLSCAVCVDSAYRGRRGRLARQPALLPCSPSSLISCSAT